MQCWHPLTSRFNRRFLPSGVLRCLSPSSGLPHANPFSPIATIFLPLIVSPGRTSACWPACREQIRRGQLWPNQRRKTTTTRRRAMPKATALPRELAGPGVAIAAVAPIDPAVSSWPSDPRALRQPASRIPGRRRGAPPKEGHPRPGPHRATNGPRRLRVLLHSQPADPIGLPTAASTGPLRGSLDSGPQVRAPNGGPTVAAATNPSDAQPELRAPGQASRGPHPDPAQPIHGRAHRPPSHNRHHQHRPPSLSPPAQRLSCQTVLPSATWQPSCAARPLTLSKS